MPTTDSSVQNWTQQGRLGQLEVTFQETAPFKVTVGCSYKQVRPIKEVKTSLYRVVDWVKAAGYQTLFGTGCRIGGLVETHSPEYDGPGGEFPSGPHGLNAALSFQVEGERPEMPLNEEVEDFCRLLKELAEQILN